MSELSRLQDQMHDKNSGSTVCIGFPPWRRSYVAAFLYSPKGRVNFKPDIAAIDFQKEAPDRLVIWGGELSQAECGQLQQYKGEILRVEDGFLRSVGLGKYYIPPLSLVFDSAGIYYDPSQPSDLEKILSDTQFTQAECDRALLLVDQLIVGNISKYNVGSEVLESEQIKEEAGERKILLVPGQVPGDASIRLACENVNSDQALLAAVREQNEHAYILYKPHPDTVSGNIKGESSSRVNALADSVVCEASIADCLAVADEVHTMTSLVGFEALMRRKKVVVYGRPFYAGWGLTEDRLAIPRRQRRLSLAELAAAVLIRYPRYIDYETGLFITPEQALAILVSAKASAPSRVIAANKCYRFVTKVRNLFFSYVYGFQIKQKRRWK